ncbi:hypothetical protein Droror1_Dr00007491 [Drosera rotundifolia]
MFIAVSCLFHPLCAALGVLVLIVAVSVDGTGTRFYVDEKKVFLKNANRPVLSIQSKGHDVYAFVNKELQGGGYGNGAVFNFTLDVPISVKAGNNEIALPISTSVKIRGLISCTIDLSGSTWEHKVFPVFTFGNQGGLDMLETILVAQQDIMLDKVLDETGRKILCSEFEKIINYVL